MKLLASDKDGFNELLAKAEAMGLDTASDDIEMRNLLMANDEVAKEAIKIKTRKENISEEMRVLYVALTRAKEKLIITGTSKDLEKELEEKTLDLMSNALNRISNTLGDSNMNR